MLINPLYNFTIQIDITLLVTASRNSTISPAILSVVNVIWKTLNPLHATFQLYVVRSQKLFYNLISSQQTLEIPLMLARSFYFNTIDTLHKTINPIYASLVHSMTISFSRTANSEHYSALTVSTWLQITLIQISHLARPWIQSNPHLHFHPQTYTVCKSKASSQRTVQNQKQFGRFTTFVWYLAALRQWCSKGKNERIYSRIHLMAAAAVLHWPFESWTFER